MKSCKYIQQSVYFAPDEIRACCQRFHVNGRLKGDVVLGRFAEGEVLTAARLLELKEKLLEGINSGSNKDCDGCNYLIEANWPPVSSETLNIISIEDHSLCNMKCTYCSPTYYGGLPPKYEVNWDSFRAIVDDYCYFAWGGGEPTIRPDFAELFTFLSDDFAAKSNHKVFTNCLTYSPALEKLIGNGRLQIITSIDAGTPETFRLVRGVPGIEKVFRNVSRYYQTNPSGVTLKYILNHQNSDVENFYGFADLINKYQLSDCTILISTDFNGDALSQGQKNKAFELYKILTSSGIMRIIFDDHFMKRSKNMSLISSTQSLSFNIEAERGFVICGTGSHAELLTERVKALYPEASVVYAEVSQNEKSKSQGDVIPYEALMSSHITEYILIGSITFASEIIARLEHLQVDRSRILPDICLL